MLYNRRIFLSVLLISAVLRPLGAQVEPADTLKNHIADTLVAPGDDTSLEEPVRYTAEDSTVALPDENKAMLYGKAQVEYGSMRMQSAVMEINWETNVVKAYGRRDSLGNIQGNPTFKDGEETMEADTIKYNLKTKKGKIHNALTRQGELLVVGKEIKKDSNDVIYMRNMKCIPCQEADARTVFKATKAKIIPDDKIVTGPMFLEIGGVPTPLGLPFGYFPNTRKQHSGILMPVLGYSAEQGFNLRDAGYYFGISDKTDLVVQGGLLGAGSWSVSARNNYNILYKCSGSIGLSMTRYNSGEREITDERHPSVFKQTNAYIVQWNHRQDNKSNPTVRFSADVDIRKRQDVNRLNAINSGQFLQNTFQSNVAFSKTWRFGAISLNGRHSQNARTGIMDITLPSLTFNVNRFYPFRRKNATRQNAFDKIQAHYIMEVQNSLTIHEDSLFLLPLADRARQGVRHSLPISTNFNLFRYITATPAVRLTSVMYPKTIRQDYDPERKAVKTRTVNVPSAGYDATFNTAFNTQVYMDYLFRGKKLKQIRHLMIPTLSYNFRPDYGAAHYGFWRQVQTDSTGKMRHYSIFANGVYSGPAMGAVNGVGINISNNVEGKFRQLTDTGETFQKKTILQNVSLQTDYNFAADSFRLSYLNLSGRTVLFKYFDIVGSTALSPYRLTVYTNTLGVEIPYEMDRYLWVDGNRYFRFVRGNLSVGTSLGRDMLEALRQLRRPTDFSNAAERGGEVRTDDRPEKLPWTVRVSYNLVLEDRFDRRVQPSHAVNFSADLTPTKFWKLGVTSGYDLNTQQLSYTRVTIYRDLKCWEGRIEWVPFGPAKSYMVAINMKLSMLSEFKIPRQRGWLDNQVQ